MYYLTPDNDGIVGVWEYGIKIGGVYGEFLHLGIISLPIDDLDEANSPEVIQAIQEMAKQFVLDNIIVTIRPLDSEEV